MPGLTHSDACTEMPGTVMQVFFMWPVEELVQRMHNSPEFCEARGQARNEPGFLHHKEARRIDAETNQQLSSPRAATYQIAADWAQPFTYLTWSTGFMFLRSAANSPIPTWPIPSVANSSHDVCIACQVASHHVHGVSGLAQAHCGAERKIRRLAGVLHCRSVCRTSSSITSCWQSCAAPKNRAAASCAPSRT